MNIDKYIIFINNLYGGSDYFKGNGGTPVVLLKVRDYDSCV